MTVWVGDQRHQQPGGFAFLPCNIPRAVRYDMASRALVLCTPAGRQGTIFRAAGWDVAKPLPEGWEITQEQPCHAAAGQQLRDRLPARAGRLTTSPSVERCAGRSQRVPWRPATGGLELGALIQYMVTAGGTSSLPGSRLGSVGMAIADPDGCRLVLSYQTWQ